MNLPRFLNSLFHEGRVRVGPIYDRAGVLLIPGSEEMRATAEFLRAFEIQYRSELAHEPPPLSDQSLRWAAVNVYRACSLLSHREVDAEGVAKALSEPCPEPVSPSVVYSVDLTYRFLPDLLRLARAASPEDCLVQILNDWARTWPLSSVGIALLGEIGPTPFLVNDCLRQIYVDRILQEQDQSRLDDPRVRESVRAALGRHSNLSPKLATSLTAEQN